MKTQVECQALCEAITRLNCVGIAYSHSAVGKECYLCKDDALRESGNGEGFYRRPGKFMPYSHEAITIFILFDKVDIGN